MADRELLSLLCGDPHFPAFVPTGIGVTVLICIFQWEISLFVEEMFLEHSAVLMVKHSQPICLPSVEDRVELA